MAMPKKDKKKKQSIRIFVHEDDIKFELYHMKYSNQLKQFDALTTEEIHKKWNYDNQKKINRFVNDLTKKENSDPIAQQALKANIEYLKVIPAPVTEEQILNDFNTKLINYRNALNERLQEEDIPLFTIEKINESLRYLEKVEAQGLQRNPNKERFGTMLLLMIKNLATMPSFSGYSENWATDFYSNAVEKVILYLDNFDENLLSKRSGGPSKAFAYVTQICFNAFVNIINIRKKENAFLKDTISYETHNFDGVQDLTTKTRDEEEEVNNILEAATYKIRITKKETDIDTINAKIQKGIEHIIKTNDILSSNKSIEKEIQELNTPGNIPEEEKNSDFFDYIGDLKESIINIDEINAKDTLKVIIPEGTNLDGVKYNNTIGINIIITSNDTKKQKVKKTKSQNSFNGYDAETGLTKKQRFELEEMEAEIQEEKDFENEW